MGDRSGACTSGCNESEADEHQQNTHPDQGTHASRTVLGGRRRRDGKLLVTDGPFAETREWIAGFDILECEDLDEAIAIAAEHPMSRFGRLELRPFWTDEPVDPAS